MSAASPSPAEELAKQISSLQRRIDALQPAVLLAPVKDEVEDLDTSVNSLAGRLGALRAAGYVFRADLEAKAQALKQQWGALRSNAQSQIAQQAPPLQNALKQVEGQMANLVARKGNVAAARPLAASLESAASGVEAKISAAEDAIRGSYDNFQNEVRAFGSRLDQLEWMMKQLAEATFSLLPTEGAVAAVKAKLDEDGKDDPKGVLYLTDQRVLFEQKEEVATKRVFFIATEKQKIQKLLLDAAVTQVAQVRASKKGLLGREDHLDVNFSLDGPVRSAHFHISGQDCNLWQGLIGRAKANDLDRERTVKLDQAALDGITKAPTKCPNYGSPFTKPIVRGQTSVQCEFCGTVTNF